MKHTLRDLSGRCCASGSSDTRKKSILPRRHWYRLLHNRNSITITHLNPSMGIRWKENHRKYLYFTAFTIQGVKKKIDVLVFILYGG